MNCTCDSNHNYTAKFQNYQTANFTAKTDNYFCNLINQKELDSYPHNWMVIYSLDFE